VTSCPREKTIIRCVQGRELYLFDTVAEIIAEEAQDGTLSKLTAMELLNRLERLYLKLHEYVSEEGWW
jgi:hypothetical protein